MKTSNLRTAGKGLTALFAAAVLFSPAIAASAQYGGGPQYGNPQYGVPQGGWDAPPQEFRDIQRQGFHDGVEGARKDFDHHRYPNVNNRSEFRHPHVPGSARADYRQGFQRGYDVAMNHLLHEVPERR